MHRTGLFFWLFLWALVFSTSDNLQALSLSEQLSHILKDRISPAEQGHAIVCREELLCGSEVLPSFYSHRDFRPAWITQEGPGQQVFSLVQALHRANREGLKPKDYHLRQIKTLLEQGEQPVSMIPSFALETLADLDLLLTDAFLLYGSHLSEGLVNPETVQAEWFVKTKKADLVGILQGALQNGQIEQALENLKPNLQGYRDLEHALLEYRRILHTGGWRRIPGTPKIEWGKRGEQVAALRSRLIITGDLHDGGGPQPEFFDDQLELALRKFQKRHGLKVDGIAGPQTWAALNVPLESRIRQIKLNMERWRWLPRDFGHRYILVNIANFELEVIEDGRIVDRMRVVVGKRYRRTPVFSGKMTYMEVNPYWHIPPRLAQEDILPRIHKDPSYLARENIRVFENWQEGAREIDPEEIDWSRITKRNFSYRLVQDPGPNNALGRVKFMFPNKFSVYLHDSPARQLFLQTRRSFSSGCIRVEKPIALAEYLLGGNPELARETIGIAMDSGNRRIIRIPEPIPVLILYWTAWVDRDGALQFRDDIYGRDGPLDKALHERPPRS